MRIDLFWNKAPRSRLTAPYTRSLALLCVALLSGCANDNLDQTQELGPLRVLALIANTPEVTIGAASVQITPWISDLDKGGEAGRTYTTTWKTCADPGISYGADPSCATALDSGSGSISTLTSGNAYTAPATPIAVDLPASTDIFWTSRTAVEKTNGVPLLFEFTLTAGSETIHAIRRIIVTSRTSGLNTNPSLTDVTIDGLSIAGALGALPTTEKQLLPSIDTNSAQSYSVITQTGTTLNKTEALTVSWFATNGEFKFNRTAGSSANTFTPPTEGSTPKGLLFLRDDRGGVSDAITIGF